MRGISSVRSSQSALAAAWAVMTSDSRYVADLSRYTSAHDGKWNTVIGELKNGRKESHWIWYIFPQVYGLGRSSNDAYYSFKRRDEAEAFLKHPTLGAHLKAATLQLLRRDDLDQMIPTNDDRMKIKSSMTLFDAIRPNDVFGQVLLKFYGNNRCRKTLDFLNADTPTSNGHGRGGHHGRHGTNGSPGGFFTNGTNGRDGWSSNGGRGNNQSLTFRWNGGNYPYPGAQSFWPGNSNNYNGQSWNSNNYNSQSWNRNLPYPGAQSFWPGNSNNYNGQSSNAQSFWPGNSNIYNGLSFWPGNSNNYNGQSWNSNNYNGQSSNRNLPYPEAQSIWPGNTGNQGRQIAWADDNWRVGNTGGYNPSSSFSRGGGYNRVRQGVNGGSRRRSWNLFRGAGNRRSGYTSDTQPSRVRFVGNSWRR